MTETSEVTKTDKNRSRGNRCGVVIARQEQNGGYNLALEFVANV
jgi:hypothetical protein